MASIVKNIYCLNAMFNLKPTCKYKKTLCKLHEMHLWDVYIDYQVKMTFSL